jgi:arylsulfatase A-like enzyme
MEHGVSVYQDQVHIPLIVKYPNQTSPSVVSVPVSHVDLMPTILDMLGYPIPAHVQGRSMRDPKRLENRDVISESFPRLAFLPYRGDQERSERSIRRGSMKMIISTRGKRELYDLSKDAPESGNLIGAEAAVAQAMEARLREWVRLAPADMAKPVSGKPADLKRLKGLGYIQ